MIINKTADDWRVTPNFTDYDQTRAAFEWAAVPDLCADMGANGCNIAYAAVDRHAAGPAGSRTALRFVSETDQSGELSTRDLSYSELGRHTRRFSNALRSLGIETGGRVFTLMGRCPELYITLLGALRNGSVVSPLFSAFGPEPIVTRLGIGEADVLVTTRALYRKKVAPVLDRLPDLRYVFVIDDRAGDQHSPGTLDFWQWMDASDDDAPIEHTTADDPALLHFTSGTTGTPKGALHVHGAVAMHYITGLYALDLHADDIYWCTADPGWVTGMSYGVIAPLLHGITSVVDEGEFDAERWYRILQSQQVTVWYTAPTAIRLLIKAGPELAARFEFPRLRFVASVGEPLNAEAVWWGKRVRAAHSRQLVADRDRWDHDREHTGLRHQTRLDGPAVTRGRRVRGAPCRGRHCLGRRRAGCSGRAGPEAGMALDVPWIPASGPALSRQFRRRPLPHRRHRQT